MNVAMIPVEILGLKPDLQTVTHTLRGLGCVHIDDISSSPHVLARQLALDREAINRQEELTFLLARTDGLLKTLGIRLERSTASQDGENIAAIRSGLDQLLPQVQSLTGKREELQAKLALLPRYEATLRKLLPIIPPSAHEPGNVSIGVLVGRVHMGVLDSVSKRILDLTAGRAEMVASDVDASTRGMFIVFPSEFRPEIEALLGREDVTRLRLPAELSEGTPDVVLQALHRQLISIPQEIDRIHQELAGLAAAWCDRLTAWREALSDELQANSVLSRFGETEMTFVITGWIPSKEIARVEAALKEAVGEAYLLYQLPLTSQLKKRAPILMQNPRPAAPFESLVGLLALPRYGHIDPTCLMAFFLPIFFGMILGDVGYGIILLVLSLALRRKYRAGVIRDVLTVLAMGSSWAIVFGFLYGEMFGTLGERFGMQAIWFERASPEHVAGLLIMTIAIGAVHVTLGLVLGVWEGIKDRNKNHLLERGGMLIGLMALFVIVGVLARQLPPGLMTPGIAILIVGIVLLGASLGWLGILMGPIEFISLIGNILSYLRIAAIGLASVYLAEVANEMAGVAGNLVVGIILAVLIHALNLTLGAFSPTIHSLRLHYVEFFRKFYEGGGRPYQPYKHGSAS
jgi:V/A-type H+/Na+-transporting ATPase subunit I